MISSFPRTGWWDTDGSKYSARVWRDFQNVHIAYRETQNVYHSKIAIPTYLDDLVSSPFAAADDNFASENTDWRFSIGDAAHHKLEVWLSTVLFIVCSNLANLGCVWAYLWGMDNAKRNIVLRIKRKAQHLHMSVNMQLCDAHGWVCMWWCVCARICVILEIGVSYTSILLPCRPFYTNM